MHDITDCLRIGDLTFFAGAGRNSPGPLTVEIKTKLVEAKPAKRGLVDYTFTVTALVNDPNHGLPVQVPENTGFPDPHRIGRLHGSYPANSQADPWRALWTRDEIEQAKGIIAEREQTSIEDASNLIRTYVWRHGTPLHEVARRVLDGSLDVTPRSRVHVRSGPQARP